MNKIVYFIGAIILSFNVSCGDFLKEYSQDQVYAKNCQDLHEMLMGSGYMVSQGYNLTVYSGTSNYFPYMFVLDDDVQAYPMKALTTFNNCTAKLYRQYMWHKRPFSTLDEQEIGNNDMALLYKYISTINVVLNYAENEFVDDPKEMREKVIGEALFLRGAYYYLLVNMYGLPYDVTNDGSDLGVPVKTTEYVEGKLFERNTVKETYALIVDDLNKAVNYLKGKNEGEMYLANEKAALILLSRVYLYLGEWNKAEEMADRAIALGLELRDLNNFNSGAYNVRDYFNDGNSPETIFTMGSCPLAMIQPIYSTSSFIASSDLLRSYNKGDMRRQCFFMLRVDVPQEVCVKSPNIYTSVMPTSFEAFIIRSAEAYINKAEAQAMLDKQDAKNTVAEIFPYRYEADSYPDLSQLSGEGMVKFIRDERRRELCFELHRWFDLRRYAVSPKYPLKTTIRHDYYDVSGINTPVYNGYYILKPYPEDKAWVLPFPEAEIKFNEGVLIDNLRDDREKLK